MRHLFAAVVFLILAIAGGEAGAQTTNVINLGAQLPSAGVLASKALYVVFGAALGLAIIGAILKFAPRVIAPNWDIVEHVYGRIKEGALCTAEEVQAANRVNLNATIRICAIIFIVTVWGVWL